MHEVLKYINEHIREKLTLEDVARRSGYSKWYFCECFKQYAGVTFGEYVRDRRMQRASLELLRGKKATQVAMEYGYETQSGFNKAFLTQYGCLPMEFKKNAAVYRKRYEERRANMYQLSDRCEILKNHAVDDKPISRMICGQWQYYTLKGMLELPEDQCSNQMLVASGIASTVRNAPAIIQEGELIVGYNFGDGGYEFLSGDDDKDREILRAGMFTEEQIDWYLAHKDAGAARFRKVEPEGEMPEKDAQMEREWAAIGRCIAENHSVIGYEKVLKLGFEGILREVERYEKQNGRRDLYDAMKLLCQAGCEFGTRYAAQARHLLEQSENTETRRHELQKIAETCAQVPAKPARSFMEAVQSLWFAHIMNTWEDSINANSLGRLDQILYPYYTADIEKGLLTKEEAFELICCLWIKLYRDYDVQQSCVGGCGPDGESAVNELSYMMLDATEALNFIRCLSVRYSQRTEKAFLKRALEVVGHVQKGVPFFFNDDVMIPALMSKGIPYEDAWNYTQIGCVETVIPGKSNPHAVTGETNLLKALEYALGNGRSMIHPELVPGLETGALAALDTYEKLEAAVYRQIEHILDATCRNILRTTNAAMVNKPRPYKSLLTEDCMENGLDFNEHGAKYDYYQVMLGGIPNLADSLMVVRQFVYEKKLYTLQELIGILESNFEDEAVRLDFINKAPKFGNDIDEVDAVAAQIMDFSCDYLDRMTEKYGLRFHAQPFTFLWMVDHGRETAATPDGRRKGEIIAYSISPMQGRDFNGFTALLNSMAKLPTKKAPGTTSAIVEVDPKLFTDSNIDLFVDILLSASQKGLCNVQFNTIDAQTLIDAQKHPDKYKNLAVRVSGFSQKFNLLDKALQDHIIGRTKHQTI